MSFEKSILLMVHLDIFFYFLLLFLPNMGIKRRDALEKAYTFFLLRMAAITSVRILEKQINEKPAIFRH